MGFEPNWIFRGWDSNPRGASLGLNTSLMAKLKVNSDLTIPGVESSKWKVNASLGLNKRLMQTRTQSSTKTTKVWYLGKFKLNRTQQTQLCYLNPIHWKRKIVRSFLVVWLTPVKQIWWTRAESQWIVTTRWLYHLQYPVQGLSRLQRIYSNAIVNIKCRAIWFNIYMLQI